eukprot:3471353-Rhodomonas_salina.1
MQPVNHSSPANPPASDWQQPSPSHAMGFTGLAPMFGSRPPPFPGMHPHFPPAPGMFPPNAFAPPALGLQQGYGMGCAPTQFPMQYV